MHYRDILLLTLILVLASCKTIENDKTKNEKPNFLLIAVDDLNTYNSVLGNESGVFLEKIYPDSAMRSRVVSELTPNLDAFAKKALTFKNAYCASPLCGPSRTALLTGVSTHVSGYYHHEKHFRHYESLHDVVTLPQYLKRNGYFTAGIGKIFHKPKAMLDHGLFSDWPDRIFSWDSWVDANIGTGAAATAAQKPNETISKYWHYKGKGKNYTRFGQTDLPVEHSNDFVNMQHIANLISKGHSDFKDIHGDEHQVDIPENQPWFLAGGIFAPHLPFIARQEFFDLFPQDEMNINKELLEWVKADLEDLSSTGKAKAMSSGFKKMLEFGLQVDGEGGDINAWKDFVQSYMATIAYADRCLGVLFDAIENSPEKENTVVVLFSDHGYHLGDKNREGKTTLWEASNHCNLMIYDPRNEASNGKSAIVGVSLQDIYPTIVSMAQLQKPNHVHGYDLSTLLHDSESNWKHPVLSTFEEGNHTIRIEEFRYIRFKNGDRELYNMVDDPFELINLVHKPEWQGKIDSLNHLLEQTLQLKPEEYSIY